MHGLQIQKNDDAKSCANNFSHNLIFKADLQPFHIDFSCLVCESAESMSARNRK